MATAKQSTKPKRISAKQKEIMRKAKVQLYALLTFALGILLFALVVVEGSSLWKILGNTLFGLFGGVAYVVPFIFIYIAVITAMDKPALYLGSKIWQSILLIFLICGGVQVFAYGELMELGLWDKVLELWNAGENLNGGGLVGAVLGLPLLALAGRTGAGIIIVLLSAVLLMIITGTTLKGLYHAAARPVKGIEKAYAERMMAENEKPKTTPIAKANKAKFNIDVPIDDTIVEHDIAETIAVDITPTIPEKKKKGKAQDAQEEQLDMPSHPVTTEGEAYLDDIIKKMQSHKKSDEDEIAEQLTIDENSIKNSKADAENAHVAYTSGEAQLSAQNGENSENPTSEELIDSSEVKPSPPQYILPPLNLLSPPKDTEDGNISDELKANAQRLVDTLQSFGVQTRITEICRGPAVTRYELQPSAGVKISKITNLADDISLNLATAGVRIEAPIPNKAAVGIEVPNKSVTPVAMSELIASPQFSEAKSKLTVALGKDIAGNLAIADLAAMTHVLIAGATGSGKSVCINSVIISLLYKASPDEVKLLMVDPKVVELGIYNGIPHLLVPVVTDPGKAAGALNWAVNEMLKRFKLFAEVGVRDITGYNQLTINREELAYMPQIVIIIDELADLMAVAQNEVEEAIFRLSQMARAAGMHLVIATQRPSVDVITGVVKSNIPSRIAFAVSSQIDSRTILDGSGAEKLLGKGDMLFYPRGYSKPVRVQGCFVSDEEVEKVVSFIKEGMQTNYDQEVIDEIDRQAVVEKQKGSSSADSSDDEDEMLYDAIEVVVEMGQASTSLLQRKLKLGYARAARIVDQLEERGIVGPFEGSKPRAVLISRERWMEMKLQRSKD